MSLRLTCVNVDQPMVQKASLTHENLINPAGSADLTSTYYCNTSPLLSLASS